MYEFMLSFGRYVKFYVCEYSDFGKPKIFEQSDKISLHEITEYKDEYPNLFSALEREAVMFDVREFIIYID